MSTKRESRGFLRELEALINSHSIENESNTPDFILAQYIAGCLKAWNFATQARDAWFNFVPFGTYSPSDGKDGQPLVADITIDGHTAAESGGLTL